MKLLDEYRRVTYETRCPVCGHPDWCLIHNTGIGALCSRVESDDPRGDAGHYHALTGGPITIPPAVKKASSIKRSMLANFQSAWTKQMDASRFRDLSCKLGVSTTSLVLLGVGWRGDCYTFPMRNARQHIVGYRLRSEDGFKWGLAGTNNGLFIPRRMFWPTVPVLAICEGPTDTAACLDMGVYGIGRPNNSSFREETCRFIRTLCPKRVVIVADSDGPGLQGAQRLRREIDVDFSPLILYTTQHSDLRDFVRQRGERASFLAALNGIESSYWRVC